MRKLDLAVWSIALSAMTACGGTPPQLQADPARQMIHTALAQLEQRDEWSRERSEELLRRDLMDASAFQGVDESPHFDLEELLDLLEPIDRNIDSARTLRDYVRFEALLKILDDHSYKLVQVRSGEDLSSLVDRVQAEDRDFIATGDLNLLPTGGEAFRLAVLDEGRHPEYAEACEDIVRLKHLRRHTLRSYLAAL